jgi:hypothetical protein
LEPSAFVRLPIRVIIFTLVPKRLRNPTRESVYQRIISWSLPGVAPRTLPPGEFLRRGHNLLIDHVFGVIKHACVPRWRDREDGRIV